MSVGASAAFVELRELGAPVSDDACESNRDMHQFRISGERSYPGDRLFVDYNGRQFRETSKKGKSINPDGIRQDVHLILAKHGLEAEWYDSAQVFVFDPSDRVELPTEHPEYYFR